jgi:hypothetical protein
MGGGSDRCQSIHVPTCQKLNFAVIAETESDFTIAIDVRKAAMARYRRFLEMLLEIGARWLMRPVSELQPSFERGKGPTP